QDGDRVVFDDTVTGSRTVTLSSGDVAPASVLVNSAGSYTINSSFAAALTGTGELIKTGAGTLTLNGPASFEGGIVVQ
ncbi:autotransporter-associated beta strand repeat-containing protein, partial [Salmonella sp. SAL4431]|uniref:autotransporter-associated beta strand repeat-containing protein n=1 Tax=Salmonella sp. SAL4431 TaxID=3159886 RepID=UPI00397979B2